jgi:hypothetical protein
VSGGVEANGSSGYFRTEFEVTKLREQTLKATVELFRLDVTIKVVAPLTIDDVRVYLRRVETEEYRNWRDDDEPALLIPDETGKISFDCLTAADYDLFIRVYDEGNVLVNAIRKPISLKANFTTTVTVTDKVGTLNVQIEGDPLYPTRGVSAWPTVYVLDAKGKQVLPGDPSLLEEYLAPTFSIPGYPVGTYTVIVAAVGFQPFEIKEVKIEKGKTTSVKATPEKAGGLLVTANNLKFDMGTNVEWTYEDALGKPLAMWLPRGSVSAATMGDHKGNGAIFEFCNLTPAVKQVRIKVAGYKDIVIKVDVKAGETLKKEVLGEKK